MRIMKSTEAADRVLKAAVALLKKSSRSFSKDAEIFITPYVNGRERGWTVSIYDDTGLNIPAVTFSENRNSDDIVVYPGNNTWWEPKPGQEREPHMITDDAYKARKYFRYDEHGKAADFAVHALMADFRALRAAHEQRKRAEE